MVKNEWIPVEKKLPKKGEYVFVVVDEKGYDVDELLDDNSPITIDEVMRSPNLRKILHWGREWLRDLSFEEHSDSSFVDNLTYLRQKALGFSPREEWHSKVIYAKNQKKGDQIIFLV